MGQLFDVLTSSWRAAAVVSATWHVDDLSSMLFMRSFYNALFASGLHPADALQVVSATVAHLSREKLHSAVENMSLPETRSSDYQFGDKLLPPYFGQHSDAV